MHPQDHPQRPIVLMEDEPIRAVTSAFCRDDSRPCHGSSDLLELSTYWMPLDEPRHAWITFGAQATLAPALTATAHAFFALSHETKALRHFTFACEQQHGLRLPQHADYWYRQAERALDEATHHWSRVACALDSLTPKELSPLELTETRRMSREARAQQERLWRLTDEVRASLAAVRGQPQGDQEEARR